MGVSIKPYQLTTGVVWTTWRDPLWEQSKGVEVDYLETGRGKGWHEWVEIIQNWNFRGNFAFLGTRAEGLLSDILFFSSYVVAN